MEESFAKFIKELLPASGIGGGLGEIRAIFKMEHLERQIQSLVNFFVYFLWADFLNMMGVPPKKINPGDLKQSNPTNLI